MHRVLFIFWGSYNLYKQRMMCKRLVDPLQYWGVVMLSFDHLGSLCKNIVDLVCNLIFDFQVIIALANKMRNDLVTRSRWSELAILEHCRQSDHKAAHLFFWQLDLSIVLVRPDSCRILISFVCRIQWGCLLTMQLVSIVTLLYNTNFYTYRSKRSCNSAFDNWQRVYRLEWSDF